MDLKEKTIIVSGGTSGIGRATAIKLAKRGAGVIVLGSNQEKGKAVEDELNKLSEGKGCFLQVDLSLVKDTQRIVNELNTRLQKADALIQSAGAIAMKPSRTPEGLDKLFVVNFLHRYILAEGCKNLLMRAQGRMIIVAANMKDKTMPDWVNFEGAQVYSGFVKLANFQAMAQSMIQYFAHEWKDLGIEVNGIHPGLVDTTIFRTVTGLSRLLLPILKLNMVKPEVPAGLLEWLVSADDVKGITGALFYSTRDYSKFRILNRSEETTGRVIRVAQESIRKVSGNIVL